MKHHVGVAIPEGRVLIRDHVASPLATGQLLLLSPLGAVGRRPHESWILAGPQPRPLGLVLQEGDQAVGIHIHPWVLEPAGFS